MNQAEENAKNQSEKSNIPKKKKNRKGFIVFFLISVLAAVMLLTYGGISIYYQSHFLPNTQINHINCSNLDVNTVVLLVKQQDQSYVLEVSGRNWKSTEKKQDEEEQNEKTVLGILTAQDINFLSSDVEEAVHNILERQNPLLWMKAFTGELLSYEMVTNYTFDEALLEKQVKSWEAFQSKNMTAPQNAYISDYSEEGYQIIPETHGTQLDIPAAIGQIKAMISEGTQAVDLDESECYKTADITSDDRKLRDNCRMMNLWVKACITYDWNGQPVVVDEGQICSWISLEAGKPALDEEAIAEFVADTARELDTYGKKRKFITALGVELTLPSGAYGWKTNREEETRELIQLIYQGSILEKEPVYISRAAGKGSNDIGSSYVEIDLSNQHLYVFQNGAIVLETDFVSGNMSKSGCMTPPGVFGLTYKTRNAVLRGEDYETPVNYWMPFNGNVGMHDATWRYKFGGDIYLTNGSHGCINLPLDMAAQIYEYVSTGFPIICYYY